MIETSGFSISETVFHFFPSIVTLVRCNCEVITFLVFCSCFLFFVSGDFLWDAEIKNGVAGEVDFAALFSCSD